MSDVDRRLANRILLGLAVGAVAGVATLLIGAVAPAVLDGAQEFAKLVLDPLGQVFLRMLFFVVIPLVFASLAMGVAQLERLGQLGPLAGRTFLLFFLNMSIAVALGMLVMNVVGPGENLAPEAQASLMAEYGGPAAQHVERSAAQPDLTPMTLVEMFMPRNLFGAFVGNSRETLGDVLPLILFAILVGAAAIRLGGERREKLRSGLGLINDLMTGIVHFALKLAPFAVPALIYSVIIKIGWDIVRGARAVRRQLRSGDAAAPVRNDVDLGAISGQAAGGRILEAVASRAGDGILDQLQRRDTTDRARGGPRRVEGQPTGGRLRAPAGHHDEHGGHGAVRGLRRAVRGSGIRHRSEHGATAHAAVALGVVGRGGRRDSRRLAAADRRPAGCVRNSARRHRHHPGRGPHPRHDEDDGERRVGRGHHGGGRSLHQARGAGKNDSPGS